MGTSDPTSGPRPVDLGVDFDFPTKIGKVVPRQENLGRNDRNHGDDGDGDGNNVNSAVMWCRQ